MLALGVREATVHRALLTSMATARSTVTSNSRASLTSTSVRLALLEAIVENSLARGDAAGVAAVLCHLMELSEVQSRTIGEE